MQAARPTQAAGAAVATRPGQAAAPHSRSARRVLESRSCSTSSTPSARSCQPGGEAGAKGVNTGHRQRWPGLTVRLSQGPARWRAGEQGCREHEAQMAAREVACTPAKGGSTLALDLCIARASAASLAPPSHDSHRRLLERLAFPAPSAPAAPATPASPAAAPRGAPSLLRWLTLLAPWRRAGWSTGPGPARRVPGWALPQLDRPDVCPSEEVHEPALTPDQAAPEPAPGPDEGRPAPPPPPRALPVQAMRHGRRVKKLGRPADQRKAMLRALTTQVFKYGRVRTTRPRAKVLRRFVDRMVTLSKSGTLAARRQALGWIYEPEVVKSLFLWGPHRYEARSGGYCRLIRDPEKRRGDNAEMSTVELVD